MEQTLNIIVPLFFAILFGFFGVGGVKRYRRITQNGTKTVATIVDFEVEEVNDSEYSGPIYFPIFEFTDSDGNLIKKKHNTSMSRKYLLKHVNIYYNKINDDYEFLVDRKGWNYFFSLILALIAITLLVISLIAIFKS